MQAFNKGGTNSFSRQICFIVMSNAKIRKMINTSTNSDPLLYLFYLNNSPKSAVHRSLNSLCFRDVAHYANKNDFRLHCLLEIIPCLSQIFLLALDHLTHSKQSPNIKHVLIHLIVIKSLLKHVCVIRFVLRHKALYRLIFLYYLQLFHFIHCDKSSSSIHKEGNIWQHLKNQFSGLRGSWLINSF